MASLGLTRFGITTKFADQNNNTVSKTYNGLNLSGSAVPDATMIDRFFVTNTSDSIPSMYSLLGSDYSVSKVERNMNNEVIS